RSFWRVELVLSPLPLSVHRFCERVRPRFWLPRVVKFGLLCPDNIAGAESRLHPKSSFSFFAFKYRHRAVVFLEEDHFGFRHFVPFLMKPDLRKIAKFVKLCLAAEQP